MKEDEVLKVLARVGAVITGSHIVYTSGRHGSAYVNKDAIYPHTADTFLLCNAIAREFSILERIPQVVIAPAVGAIILSQWVAHRLRRFTGRDVLAVYADKEGDSFVIKRGYDKLVTGKRVVVVEDVLTTGGSARKVVDAVRAIDGDVMGVGVLCNRGGVTQEDLGVRKLFALVNIKMDSWDEVDCPLCKEGMPINTDVGKGREFLARQT